jgi:DnaJ homologue, subfamily C, member 28, conserved domain
MIPGFENIVEQRIRSAQKKGEFDDLPGAGKPIEPDDGVLVPDDLRMAYKMLKNADCLPPVIELQKEIITTEALLENVADEKEAYGLLKKLNFMVMKLNTMRAGSIELEVPQEYQDKVLSRFDKKKADETKNK